ncbi:MAG TPA: hypothetical protein VHL52_11400 [Acidimicrobiia bacterium]|nr:hypothetical protein [Acidimicrobiia bacterium]
MHIAPVVLVQHHLGPEGWSKALAAVAETLNRHSDLTLTVRASGAVLEHAVRSEPRTWNRHLASLAHCRRHIPDLVRTGVTQNRSRRSCV